jgi:hypothetical protein
MLTQQERAEIDYEVHLEMARIEQKWRERGSYQYLCFVGGLTFFAHSPVGHVIRAA